MSRTIHIFPGQGSQFPGMGSDLYESSAEAHDLFEYANQVLGFRLSDVMFSGSEEDLLRTEITQPAVFLHSIVAARALAETPPVAVAGHSLGEYAALVAAEALTVEDGLRLVSIRARAMQRACDEHPGAMAVVLGLTPDRVEEVCQNASGQVVAANFNNAQQTVISGDADAIMALRPIMKAAGARRTILLPVAGAFHSPLMFSAEAELREAIESTSFQTPRCPIYQNVDSLPHTTPDVIRGNLIAQLTTPVRWWQTIEHIRRDYPTCSFREFGPGEVLTNLLS